jgi:phenylacetate-CoA ligase
MGTPNGHLGPPEVHDAGGQQHPVVRAFQDAAADVPGYRRILAEAGVRAQDVHSLDDFRRLVPVIDKAKTFGRFPIADLCRGGRPGPLAGVLTSSGQSGRFAMGLYDAQTAETETQRTDDALDALFHVRSRSTLLVNCLPMGVRVHTRACTLAETSVRADMVVALVSTFAPHYEQIILVAEPAFLKHVLELGQASGIEWHGMLAHAIVGEEPLAENARKYLQVLLGIDPNRPETGLIGSSMGVAELGLNLLFELPPLILLRRLLHEKDEVRAAVLGPSVTHVPMLLTYDSRRIFVEIADEGGLLVSTLEHRCVPLIRYETGDAASWLAADVLGEVLTAAGIQDAPLTRLPVVMLHGRGQCVRVGEAAVYPEQVKEGLYHDAALARLTTANYRLSSEATQAMVRVQLSPGVEARDDLPERFRDALSRYVRAPLTVRCEAYEAFRSGVALDYERKFDYLGP